MISYGAAEAANHVQRRCRPSRPHRSRSKALGETSATDPSSEITPTSVKNVAAILDFIGRPKRKPHRPEPTMGFAEMARPTRVRIVP
jgi:hypothetical protein